MINDIKDLLTERIHSDAIEEVQESGLQPALYIRSEHLLPVCSLLRDTDGLYFDFLANLTAVDYFPDPFFEIVYNLTSIPYQKQLTLKVRLVAERGLEKLPMVPSVAEIWRTAEWHEREAFDLMGVFFTEHPDLRRILMPEDWTGHPLRKDYSDPETYHGIPIK
ncbi:MAG: NADH-quinone oxidoreductase subunit C [Sphingobacterium sp.]